MESVLQFSSSFLSGELLDRDGGEFFGGVEGELPIGDDFVAFTGLCFPSPDKPKMPEECPVGVFGLSVVGLFLAEREGLSGG